MALVDATDFVNPSNPYLQGSSNSWKPLVRLEGGELVIQEKGLNAIKEETHLHEANLAAFITVIGQCNEEDDELTELVRTYLDCENLNATNTSPRPFVGPQGTDRNIPTRHVSSNENGNNSNKRFCSGSRPMEEDAVVVWSKALVHGYSNNKVAVFLIQIPSRTVDPIAYTKLTDFCILMSSLTIVTITRSIKESPAWDVNHSVLPKTSDSDRACFQKVHFILRSPNGTGLSRFVNEKEITNSLANSKSWEKFSFLKEFAPEVRFLSLQSLTQWGLWQYLRKTLETDTLRDVKFSQPWYALMGSIWKTLYVINKPVRKDGNVKQERGPSPDSDVIQIVEQLTAEYMPQLQRLKSVWIKILFLDTTVLDYEFKTFVRQVMTDFESKVGNGKRDGWVENMLLAGFKREFQAFKTEYAEKHSRVSDGEKLINDKLTILEEEFRQSWEQGRVEEFLDQLSSKYPVTTGSFDVSSLDTHIMSQLQLYVAKRYACHEMTIRKAAETLIKIYESMKEEFTKYMRDPVVNDLPGIPGIPSIAVDGMKNAKTIDLLMESLVHAKYEKMAHIARDVNQDADAKVKAAQRFIRDRAVQQFKLKIDEKPKSAGDDDDGIPRHPVWNLQLGSVNPIVLKVYSEHCNPEICM